MTDQHAIGVLLLTYRTPDVSTPNSMVHQLPCVI